MSQERLLNYYKTLIIWLGFTAFIVVVFSLGLNLLNWQLAVFAFFTFLIAPKLSFVLYKSKIILSFSDTIVFFTFLYFGGREAVVIATLEMFAFCFLTRGEKINFQKLEILNISISALSTTLTFLSWKVLENYSGIGQLTDNISNLITTLGILCLSQLISSSFFISIYFSIKNNENFIDRWKKDLLSIAVTQIVGVITAGIIYKLIVSGNFITTLIISIVITILYFNYRKIVKDMNVSNDEAERAQREKAESEQIRAEQAETHAKELGVSLLEQERISEELQKSNDALEHAAFHDALTKLPNRAYLIERLNLLLEIGIDISHKYYVIFLDIHRFKNINDSLGHTVGDKVLMLAARRLLRVVKMEDTVARLGGDEFAIILNDLSSVEEAKEFAKKINHKMTQPFSFRGHKIYANVHMGISPFDVDHKKPEDILRDADIAMHHAKERGTDFAVFDKDLRSSLLEKITLEADLRFAIQKNELSMHYQPLISLKDGGIIGFEALLRWNHSKLGFIPPIKFIPIAEESGLIIPITNWILKQTTNQISEWQSISSSYRHLMVSVNISGKHLVQEGLVEEVKKVLKDSQVNPSGLKLEITESTAMNNPERSIDILNRLKELGVQLSIDDFGTGYSSLSYLHDLPFDTLKIDKSFVYQVGENGENSQILQTIISLAKNLKMRVIAEGIETESQLQLLINLGCNFGQGYLFCKPLPKHEMEELLYKRHVWLPKSFLSHADENNSAKKHPKNERLLIQ